MAKEIVVQGKNSGKKYRFAYDDINELQKKYQEAKDWIESGGDEIDAVDTSMAGNLARMAGQGVSMGGSDEVLGGLYAVLGNLGVMDDLGYKHYRDEQREKNAIARLDNPKSTLAAEVIAGMAMPGGVLKNTVGNIGRVKTAMAGVKPLGRLAGAGAGTGALAGTLYSDREGADRLKDAAVGGLFGLGTGLAAGGATHVLGRGLATLGDRSAEALGVGVEKAADKAILKGMKQAGIRNADDLGQAMDTAGSSLLADIAGAPQDLAMDASRRSGSVMERAKGLIDSRRPGAYERLHGEAQRALDNPLGLDDMINKLDKEGIARTKDLYKAADKVNIPVTKAVWDRFEDSGTLQEAADIARKAVNKDKPKADRIPEYMMRHNRMRAGEKNEISGEFAVRTWKALKDKVDGLYKAKQYAEAEDAKKVRDAYKDWLYTANKPFAEAQDIYHGKYGLIDAANFGQDAIKNKIDPVIIQRKMDSFKPLEQQAVKSGLITAIKDQLLGMTKAGPLKDKLGSAEHIEQALDILIKDPDKLARLMKASKAEAIQGATASRLRSGKPIDAEVKRMGQPIWTQEGTPVWQVAILRGLWEEIFNRKPRLTEAEWKRVGEKMWGDMTPDQMMALFDQKGARGAFEKHGPGIVQGVGVGAGLLGGKEAAGEEGPLSLLSQ